MPPSTPVRDERPAAPTVRLALAITSGFLALQAVYGAIVLSGGSSSIPEPPASLPGDGWGFGSIALLLLVALPLGVTCGLQARRSPQAPVAAMAGGLLLVGFMAVQLVWVGPSWRLAPFVLVLGALVAVGGWWQARAGAVA